MTQAIEILERHRLFLIEVEREADVQYAIKAVVITVKQQAEEIERLRELVKRHEAALEWLSDTADFDSLHKNWKSGLYALCKLGKEEGISPAMQTPLAAIEAAIKEEK